MAGRLHSYDDLSSSMSNGLQRSTSDPSLTGSLSLESSSMTLRTVNGASQTPPSTHSCQPNQLNRLHNSTSTNSLFGPPHHLGTLNGSQHNMTTNSSNGLSTPTSPNNNNNNNNNNHHHYHPNSNVSPLSINPMSMHDSPENRIKRQSFTTDDSAPDITQLALSFQRFPLNVNSVDNILRTMARPRKHTNSTSSTGSSLSEAWSLTKINSHDSHQTTRTVDMDVFDVARLDEPLSRLDTSFDIDNIRQNNQSREKTYRCRRSHENT
jgi:hypothetical protein